MRSKLIAALSFVLFTLAAPAAARAGGPLYIDPATLTPIRYAPGPTDVYTDLGTLGLLSNAQADERIAFAWRQWTDVPSSSFEARIAGDVTRRGVADITAANITDVIGAVNGRGIDVVYDADGTIFSDFFGAGPYVLGIATPEFGVDGTNEITESWVVLNGAAIDPADTEGIAFTGVMTHEFGHAINLGHSQVNGGAVFFGDAAGPAGCETYPYAGSPTSADLETMYPFIDQRIDGGSGVAQSTVDVTDDIVSLSNIYPVAGWPATSGSVSGTVTYPDGSQIQGVDVVARNLADPFHDAVSAMSGDVTRGYPDALGQYTINGLTPGASYAVYVEGIVAGGFSIPPALFLPGAEEFYNGSSESADATTDPACNATAITSVAGTPVVANIAFNAEPGAPQLRVLGRDAAPFDMTADGSIIVGYFASYIGAPAWRWTESAGLEDIGGVGSTAAIATDGSALVSNTLMDDGFQVASLWQGGQSWLQLPGLEGSCDGALPPTKSVAFGVSNGGKRVVGLGFFGDHCDVARAFQWDAATNTTIALETPEGSLQSRANGISRDGSVVWGFRVGDTGFREAAIWTNGQYQSLSTDEAPVGEAYNASPNGKYVVGGYAGLESKGWLWSAKKGLRLIDGLPDTFQTQAFAVNGSGTAIVGQSGGFFDANGFLWTPALGTMRLDEFLRSQGTYVDPTVSLYAPNTMSSNGRRIAGNAFSANGGFGWFVDLNKIRVCHAPDDPAKRRTVEVSFPEGMDKHLGHGDVLGACERLKW